jgi:hypothetical protein
MQNSETGYGLEEAGMAQLDDSVGALLKHLAGKCPSKRHEVFYFGGPQLGAIRLDDFKFTFFV